MSLGSRLRALRTNSKLTQQRLADTVGVSRIYIQALESNRRMPSMKLLKRLAEALETPVTDIVSEYPGSKSRMQLEELLSSGEVDIWFRKKKLSEGELKRVEKVIQAVLECWEHEDAEEQDRTEKL